MRLDQLVETLDPEVAEVRLTMDRQAASKVEQARRRVELATHAVEQAEDAEQGSMSKPETAKARTVLEQAREQLAEAEQAADAKTVSLHVRELGNARWKKLLWLVPPTAEQRDRVGRGLDHNPELFPVVALAFSLVDVDDDGQLQGPAIDQEQLDGLYEALEKAAGDPAKAVKAADEHMPDAMVKLNAKMRAGGWEKLTAKMYELNLEVSQVPLSSSVSRTTPTS